MKVIITDRCDRCKREAPREIEHTEVEAYEAAEKVRQENLQQLQAQASQGPLPDLVVLFKGRTQSTNHICDANCKATIEHALEAVFKDIDPSQRAPRKTRKSGEVPVEEPNSSESSAASTTSTPASDGGSKPAGKRKK